MAESVIVRSGQVGAASLFACAARGDVNIFSGHLCGWCLGSGDGTLVKIGDVYVLSSHTACLDAVRREQGGARAGKVNFVSGDCCCYERMGDNENCPVHGGAK